jgi:hypothetical protein
MWWQAFLSTCQVNDAHDTSHAAWWLPPPLPLLLCYASMHLCNKCFPIGAVN